MEQSDMEQRKKDEEQSLAAFLEQDKDMVMAQLSADRTQENAVRVLEKETDRLMYRAGAFDARKAPAAQGMLQVLKSALPLRPGRRARRRMPGKDPCVLLLLAWCAGLREFSA